ncbi:MAG: hypothetical protein J0H08_03260, partial [Rhizobiales bacterium]|nr:hypothetical protein [Hyphomicrobiales bacterium]
GGGGSDVLDGGAGSDLLAGGKGADAFRFAAGLARAGIDTIRDFTPGKDTIVLSPAVFTALGEGPLDGDAFVLGKRARDDDDHVLYHRKSGLLRYDANGDAAGGVTTIARLPKKLDLDADDFLVA